MKDSASEQAIQISENDKNAAAFIHISTFSKYFIPFGNFIGPIILWTVNKERPFVDHHGRNAINFQLSVFVYTLIICLLCIPFFAIFVTDFVSLVEAMEHHTQDISISNIENIVGYTILICVVGILFLGIFIFELYAVINAAMHAAKGKEYKYPFTINFLGSNQNQSK